MRLADEILLLLTDDDSGAMSVPEPLLDKAVAAGVLVDLESAGLLEVADVDGPAPDGSGIHVTTGRLQLTPASNDLTGDAVLDAAVSAVRPLQGRPIVAALPILGRAVYPSVHRALAAEGVLVRDAPPASAGMRPHTAWKTADPEPEQQMRSELRHVLAGDEVTPEQRRHARLVVILLQATGTLEAALSDLEPEVRQVAAKTEPPMDATPVFTTVLRALNAD